MLNIQSPLQGLRSPFGGRRGFNPASVFLPGDVGWAYDTQNLASMFQDVAGTIPANQPGHPVGLRLDTKHGLALGPEWWASQSPIITEVGSTSTWTPGTRTMATSGGTSGQYPWFAFGPALVMGKLYDVDITLSGDVAKLNSITIGGVNLPASATIRLKVTASAAPLIFKFIGTAGAATVTIDSISVRELPGIHATQPVAASRLTLARRPASGVRNLLTNTDAMATQSVTVSAVSHTLSFTGTGTVTLSGASTAGPLVGTGADNRVSLTFTPTAGSLTMTVTGSVTFGQLELGATATAYQRVGSIYDVTEAPYRDLWCLVTDGIDDGMVTPTITPAVGADKVQVVAGVRKLSDAANSILVEYSGSIVTNNGSFAVGAPTTVSVGNYAFYSKGTGSSTASANGYPITSVVTGLGDIAGDSTILRVNGAQVAASAADQGTGQIGTYPAYLYRRGGTSLPAKVEDYGMICRISTTNLTAAQIGQLEAWANQRTGAY